jgi:hypothetical protein
MKKLTITRKGVRQNADSSAFVLTLEVISSEGITKNVFVKQRLRTIDNGVNDVFVAVASPTQIEDLPEGAPVDEATYFRTNKVDIISQNPTYLEEVFDDILQETQSLVDDVTSVEVLQKEGTYTVEAMPIYFDPEQIAPFSTAASKVVTLQQPTANEFIIIFFTSTNINVIKLITTIKGSDGSDIDWTLKFGPNVGSSGTEVITGGMTTGVSESITTFSNPAIPAGSYIWFTTSAVHGTVDEFHVTILFNNQ